MCTLFVSRGGSIVHLNLADENKFIIYLTGKVYTNSEPRMELIGIGIILYLDYPR